MSRISPTVPEIKGGIVFEHSTIEFGRVVRKVLNQLTSDARLGTGGKPTFAGLTLSDLTEGSVLFAGPGGVISQDNDNLFWNDSTNMLGIGTSPARPLDISGSNTVVQVTRYGDDDNPPSFFSRKSRGSIGSEAAVQVDDRCGGTECYGWDGNSFQIGCYFGGTVDGAVSDGDVPMAWVFETGSALIERLRIDSDGDVGIGTDSPNERLEVTGKIRANTAFNLNGTDGVSGTYPVYNDGTEGNVTEIIVSGGIITSVTVESGVIVTGNPMPWLFWFTYHVS